LWRHSASLRKLMVGWWRHRKSCGKFCRRWEITALPSTGGLPRRSPTRLPFRFRRSSARTPPLCWIHHIIAWSSGPWGRRRWGASCTRCRPRRTLCGTSRPVWRGPTDAGSPLSCAPPPIFLWVFVDWFVSEGYQ